MSSFIGVRHVGLAAKDPAALAAFYRDVMGMTVVGETPANSPLGATLFLGGHPEEENHDVVFFSNPAFAHTAFRMASLGKLLTFYRQIKQRGLPIKMALNHGSSLAFYFDDPEGNMIEIYWATNVRVRHPYADPIDFDLSEEELLRDVERVAQQFGQIIHP
ncbi:MAG: VOC family protein [Ktedonobacteraceae bacterium]|nr:VOC family protein [Ktedonobacteraceae bacterium]